MVILCIDIRQYVSLKLLCKASGDVREERRSIHGERMDTILMNFIVAAGQKMYEQVRLKNVTFQPSLLIRFLEEFPSYFMPRASYSLAVRARRHQPSRLSKRP